VVDSETVQEPDKKPDNQPGQLVNKNYNYIYIALTLIFIAFIFLLNITEDSSIPSPAVQIQEPEQTTKTETTNLIKPTHHDATQFFAQIEQDNNGNLIFPPEAVTTTTDSAATFNRAQMTELASVLRARGWITEVDNAGNLKLTPGATDFTNSKDTKDVLIPTATDLASFRALLESRGWQVNTNTVNGDVLLIPLSSP